MCCSWGPKHQYIITHCEWKTIHQKVQLSVRKMWRGGSSYIRGAWGSERHGNLGVACFFWTSSVDFPLCSLLCVGQALCTEETLTGRLSAFSEPSYKHWKNEHSSFPSFDSKGPAFNLLGVNLRESVIPMAPITIFNSACSSTKCYRKNRHRVFSTNIK